MLFEFLTGKLLINIDKLNFSLGDTIEGTVVLKLKKPLKAKGLRINLVYAMESRSRNAKGGSSTNVTNLLDVPLELDSEKEYPSEEKVYKFNFAIPKDEPKLPSIDIPDPKMKAMVEGISKFVMANASGAKYWYLEARLDIPWGVDLTKQVRFNVT